MSISYQSIKNNHCISQTTINIAILLNQNISTPFYHKTQLYYKNAAFESTKSLTYSLLKLHTSIHYYNNYKSFLSLYSFDIFDNVLKVLLLVPRFALLINWFIANIYYSIISIQFHLHLVLFYWSTTQKVVLKEMHVHHSKFTLSIVSLFSLLLNILCNYLIILDFGSTLTMYLINLFTSINNFNYHNNL